MKAVRTTARGQSAGRVRSRLRGKVAFLFSAMLGGCVAREPSLDLKDHTQPSPKASIKPAPLRSGIDLAAPSLPADAGTTADAGQALVVPLREDVALEPDRLGIGHGPGLALTARFIWHAVPRPVKLAKTRRADLVMDGTALRLQIRLCSPGRMRFELGGGSFLLPRGTQLRSSTDFYGHILVWPDGQAYRVLGPGTLRALFNERRADVSPLVTGSFTEQEPGSRLLGLPVRQFEVETQVGKLALSQTETNEPGGALLCRLLVELVGSHPSTQACSETLVPLTATYAWHGGGRLSFEVERLEQLPDLDLEQMRVPPSSPAFKADRLPAKPAVLVSEETLRSLHPGPISLSSDALPMPKELVLENPTPYASYFLLEGIPAAIAYPFEEVRILQLAPGSYTISWRDFLGGRVDPEQIIELPARVIRGNKPEPAAPGPR